MPPAAPPSWPCSTPKRPGRSSPPSASWTRSSAAPRRASRASRWACAWSPTSPSSAPSTASRWTRTCAGPAPRAAPSWRPRGRSTPTWSCSAPCRSSSAAAPSSATRWSTCSAAPPARWRSSSPARHGPPQRRPDRENEGQTPRGVSGLVGRGALLHRQVALLVLLAAPARAGVVAPHPRPGADDGRGLVLHHRAALAAGGGGRLAVALDGLLLAALRQRRQCAGGAPLRGRLRGCCRLDLRLLLHRL